MNTALLYTGVACLVTGFIAVPVLVWWENHQDKRDKQLWDEIYGTRRPW